MDRMSVRCASRVAATGGAMWMGAVLVGAALCACGDGQTDGAYRGEPLMALRGVITTSQALVGEGQVPALMGASPTEWLSNGEPSVHFIYGEVEGTFPTTPLLAFSLRGGLCTSTLSGRIASRTNELGASVRALHAIDLSARLSLDLGMGLGVAYFVQHFEQTERAPTRRSGAAHADVIAGISYELGDGLYLVLDSALRAYVLPLYDAVTRTTQTQARLLVQTNLGGGVRF